MIRTFNKISPQLSQGVYVDESAVVIGDVVLGDDVSVWPLTVIRGDVNKIRIGARTNIQDGSVLHVSRPTTKNPDGHALIIGQHVTVAHKVMLHGCTIGDRCLIGMSATVMDGARIENDVIVAAGSLVSPGKVLKTGGLYQGQPARRVRELSLEEIAYLVASADNYVDTKNQYLEDEAP